MNDQTNHGFTIYGKTPKGVEMALALDVRAFADPAELASYCAQVDAALAAQGFTRSDRLEPRAFGNGFQRQQKAEDQPPADLVVPEHCGQPMKYIAPRDRDGKEPVAAHWDCRKGRGCAEPRTVGENTYPFTNWHLTKKPAGTQAEAPAGTPVASRHEPMGFGDFLNKVIQAGFTRAQALKAAGFGPNDNPKLEALGESGWLDLLDKMKTAREGVAAA